MGPSFYLSPLKVWVREENHQKLEITMARSRGVRRYLSFSPTAGIRDGIINEKGHGNCVSGD